MDLRARSNQTSSSDEVKLLAASATLAEVEIDLMSPDHPDRRRSSSPSKDISGKKSKDKKSSVAGSGSLSETCCPDPAAVGRQVRSEVRAMGRVTWQMLKGEGSALSYLFIPALISLLWLIVCFMTTRNANISLEQRLSQSYYKEYFHNRVFEEGLITNKEIVEAISVPEGVSVNVVIAIPFLDVNPIAASEYIKTLEWILIYSTVPVAFHIITNKDSIKYVNTIVEMVNKTSNCDFTAHIVTLADIIDKTTNEICPSLNIKEEFCEIIMGNMTPLIFPYLFPDLDHAIYISRELVFQDNIGLLYNIIKKMKRGKEGIAMAPEQTKAYMTAFSGWQRLNPKTKLGRPPPDGKPGFNPDLMLLDLDKLRSSAKFKTYFDERKVNTLVKTFVFHSSGEVPSLGDMVNLIAADSENLIYKLGCEWNRLAHDSGDVLDKQFNVCKGVHKIHVWNGNPNLEKMNLEKERAESRHLVPIDHEEELEDL